MARGDGTGAARAPKACCLVSEMLEEAASEESIAAEPGRRTGARHVAAPAARMLGSAR